jgi:hypothetical protein
VYIFVLTRQFEDMYRNAAIFLMVVLLEVQVARYKIGTYVTNTSVAKRASDLHILPYLHRIQDDIALSI